VPLDERAKRFAVSCPRPGEDRFFGAVHGQKVRREGTPAC
jgi:hypothetical protein